MQLQTHFRWRIFSSNWLHALPYAIPITIFILWLFYYSFAIANRYLLFLYTHLNAGPFDPMTNGRYWMLGLVISGAVLLLYAITNWYLGRFAGLKYKTYTPPAWWRVWGVCFIPISIGIPIITTTVGQPTLPLNLAAVSTISTLLGLAIALVVGTLSANQLGRLLWLTLASIGLIPPLLILRFIELPGQGMMDTYMAYFIAMGSCVAALIWLTIIIASHARKNKRPFTIGELLTAGFAISYLILPFIHFLLLTPPGAHYITASANFFAKSLSVQMISFFAAWLSGSIAIRSQPGLAHRFGEIFGGQP